MLPSHTLPVFHKVLLVLSTGIHFVGALVVGVLDMVPVHLKASMFGADVGKNLYLFSGMWSWIFQHCTLKAMHSLSAAPCPVALLSVQLAQ